MEPTPSYELQTDQELREARRRLLPHEIFWRDHQQWLEESGYMLRPRYRPDWQPSWNINEYARSHEDAIFALIPKIMDATRIADGRIVVLKHVIPELNPLEIDTTHELTIGDDVDTDSRNHCIPLFDQLSIPDSDEVIMVFPLLRHYDDPPFETIGEFVEFVRQVIEGVQFMHERNIAHRDIMLLNTMMDPNPMFPELYHPEVNDMSVDMQCIVHPFSRTERPTTYYLIDFGLSRQYPSYESTDFPIEGGIKTVPEFQGDLENVPANPFLTDIYYLGYMIQEILEDHRGLKFLRPLINDMMQEDPSKRPWIDEVASRFADIQKSLRWWQLRSRLVPTDEGVFEYLYHSVRHIFRTYKYMAKGYEAIPTPPKDSRIKFCNYREY
ncbi:kinase-like domain-containing protein [Abortiporus biennis]|nr:kinase-like domain-containing protein [Abortiporus biennis]